MLGDLPDNLQDDQQGDSGQELPVGLRLPADIASQTRSASQVPNVKTGDPRKNVYTVSTYDSRPPSGKGVSIQRSATYDTNTEINPVNSIYADIADTIIPDVFANTQQWTVLATYSPLGGQVFVLKNLSFCILASVGDLGTTPQIFQYRICVDGVPQQGLDRLFMNTSDGVSDIDVFLPVGSNTTLTFEFFNPTYTSTPTNIPDVLFRTIFTGDLLLSQNVTLPWEACNVE